MERKQILILQGGGALGAYECGVYQVLARRLENLSVVAGASIGAINASMIARYYHQHDHGAGILKRLWKEVLANPSFPFFPFPGALQRWNAVCTSMMFGNTGLFTPHLQGWNPFNPFSVTAFSSARPMQRTLDEHFGAYGPGQAEPRLIVTAVDVEDGTSKAFDSWHECITAQQVVASGSLPPGYPATEVKGRFYWDGGLWSNTPLPEVLNALQQSPASDWSPEYEVYIVDVFPSQGQVPQNGLQLSKRFAEIIFADKTAYDQKSAQWVNRCIELVQALQRHQQDLPPELITLAEKYQPVVEKRVLLNIHHIRRSALPYEEISSGSDFSPERLDALIAQGYEDACQQLGQDITQPRQETGTKEHTLAQ
jgi:NTE family protein